MNYATLKATFAVSILTIGLVACGSQSSSNDQSPSPPTAFTDAPDTSGQTTENPNPTTPPDMRMNISEINGSIHDLMATYSSLHSRVEDIIASTKTGADVGASMQDGGSQWYSDERNFQSHIGKLPITLVNNQQYIMVKGNLAEAEEFLYSAGTDAMASCNAANARLELKVADYFYAAAKHEMTTGTSSAYDALNPPQVDTGDNECSQQ